MALATGPGRTPGSPGYTRGVGHRGTPTASVFPAVTALRRGVPRADVRSPTASPGPPRPRPKPGHPRRGVPEWASPRSTVGAFARRPSIAAHHRGGRSAASGPDERAVPLGRAGRFARAENRSVPPRSGIPPARDRYPRWTWTWRGGVDAGVVHAASRCEAPVQSEAALAVEVAPAGHGTVERGSRVRGRRSVLPVAASWTALVVWGVPRRPGNRAAWPRAADVRCFATDNAYAHKRYPLV